MSDRGPLAHVATGKRRDRNLGRLGNQGVGSLGQNSVGQGLVQSCLSRMMPPLLTRAQHSRSTFLRRHGSSIEGSVQEKDPGGSAGTEHKAAHSAATGSFQVSIVRGRTAPPPTRRPQASDSIPSLVPAALVVEIAAPVGVLGAGFSACAETGVAGVSDSQCCQAAPDRREF
jgi:hypothetical protein